MLSIVCEILVCVFMIVLLRFADGENKSFRNFRSCFCLSDERVRICLRQMITNSCES